MPSRVFEMTADDQDWLAIAESGLARYDVDRMAALLRERARTLRASPFKPNDLRLCSRQWDFGTHDIAGKGRALDVVTRPQRRYLLTRWSTIVFASDSGELRHGDFRSTPKNVYLSPGGILHIEGQAAQKVELVPGGHGILHGLKQDKKFFCADAQGGFSVSRILPDALERFLFITAEQYQDILAILENDWTLANGEIVPSSEISLRQDFILDFGTRKLDLAEHTHALIVERAGAHLSAICFVAVGWQVCTARRFQPLIYFAIFGATHFSDMLRLALESILQFGNYAGKIFILSDRTQAHLTPYIPKGLAANVLTGWHGAEDHIGMSMGRYEIAEHPIDAFQPVLYIDADMICNAPLLPLLADCNQADSFYSSSEHGVTLDQMEDWLGEWFGHFLFTAAGLRLADFHGLNTGALVFSNTHFARPIFSGIKTGYESYRKDFPVQSKKGDQPFVSFTLQSRNLVDPTRLNRYIRFKRHNFNSSERKTGLVHFNFGLGIDKTHAMSAYLGELLAGANSG